MFVLQYGKNLCVCVYMYVWPVYVRFQFVFLSTWQFVACLLATQPFTFDFSYCTKTKPFQKKLNEIPVRMRIATTAMAIQVGELTGFYYFSFCQYADEIWCMFNVLEMQGTRPNKNAASSISSCKTIKTTQIKFFAGWETLMRLTKEILKELHSRPLPPTIISIRRAWIVWLKKKKMLMP